MTLIAVGSVHGSPGTTTLALDLACLCSAIRGHPALLVEADPDGGCLAARLDLAVRPGLTELAGAARVSIAAEDVWNYAQTTSLTSAHGVDVIVAHPASEQVTAALRAAVNHVAPALRDAGVPVFVDVGRLRPGSPALAFAAVADRTVVVSANSVEAVVSLHHRASLLRSVGDPVVVLAAGRPYTADDVVAATGQPVWGVIERDARRWQRRKNGRELRRLLDDCLAVDQPPVLVGA